MTQKSWPWAAPGVGDGSTELNEADSREFLAHLWVHDLTAEGVFKGLAGDLAGELEVAGTASPLTVQPGAAICYGLYMSDAEETLAVSTPAVDTTGFRVVLRTNWAGTSDGDVGEAQTRLAVVENSDGVASIPALTQSFGTVWEISLATGTITTGGTITLTDDRTFRKATGITDTAELEDAAVTPAKLAAAAVTAAKIADGNVSTSKLANVAVTLAKLADDSVDDTKAGDRVPQFFRRQGGDASNWAADGSTDRTPGAVRMQAGSEESSDLVTQSISFPVPFSDPPLVFVSLATDAASITEGIVYAFNVTASEFDVEAKDLNGNFITTNFTWLAIGPE